MVTTPHTRTLRAPVFLRQTYRAALEDEAERHSEFSRGVAAALAWVLGEADLSPATERVAAAAPEIQEIVMEYQDAGDVPYYRGKKLPLNPGYAIGVEHALMWAVYATRHPPI